jgi:tape measure domain-containing protein
MSSPIDTAHVLIVPDLSKFESETETGIDTAFRGIDSAVDVLIASMEAQFSGLADQLTADFADIAAGATASFDEMASASVAGTEEMSATFAAMGERVDAIFEEMQLSADRDLNQIAAKSVETGSRVSGAFGALAGAAKLGAFGVATGLGAVSLLGLKSAASLEQVDIAFQSLTGSVAAGNAQFKALQTFAAATPFNFSDLTTAAQRFDAFSGAIGQSQQQLIPFLTTIGNLVSETGGGAQALDSISLALGQTASQGKITLGNLNQINNAIPGFSSVAALAAVRGESTAQVMQEISAGSIDAKTGINQLLQGMQQFPGAAGAMDKQAQTLLGVFSTFQDTASQALSNSFAPVIPLIKDSLGQITPIIGNALSVLGPSLGKLISTLLPVLGNLLTGIVPIITPVLDALSKAFEVIGPVLGPLGAAIGKIFKALEPLVPVFAVVINQLVTALTPVIAQLAPVIANLVGPIGDLLLALVPLIPPLGELLVSVVQLLVPLSQLIGWLVEMDIAKVIVPEIAALAYVVKAVAAALGWLAGWISKINWKEVGDAIAGAFTKVVGFFKDLPGNIVSFLEGLPTMLGNLAAKAFDMFFTVVGYGIGLIIKEFAQFPGQVIGIVVWLYHSVTDLLQKLWKDAVNLFVWGVDRAVAYVASLPGRVWDWLMKLPALVAKLSGEAMDWLYNAGKNIIMGLIHGIEDTVSSAIHAVTKAMGDIVHGAEGALGINSPSKVFMEIGHQVVAGFAGGVDNHAPAAGNAVQGMLGAATPSSATAAATSGAGSAPLFGPGSIVLNFSGAVSPADAYAAGTAVGHGIADVLSTMAVNNTVRAM